MLARRTLLAAAVLGIASSLSVEAQEAGKIYRIGLLSLGPPSTFARLTEAFREGMREVGYIEGKHYILEMRNAAGKPDELPYAARTLVAGGVDVILVGSGITLAAARAATQTIPIVIATATGDPVRRGVVRSLAQPGGNVTGVTGVQMEEMAGKWLQFMREVVPDLSRILVVMNPGSQSQSAQDIEAVAKTLGIAFLPIPVTNPEDIDIKFANLTVRRGDALIVFSEATIWARRARIADLVARKKLPAIYTLKGYVEAGGLMSYAASQEDSFRRSAVYVAKILRGAKPGDLPIDRPTKFELAVNLKTAKALGLTIPPSLLVRADHVID